MKFKIGDRVNFLNETGAGIITKVLNNTMVIVAIEEGFDIPFPINQLILIQKKTEITEKSAEVSPLVSLQKPFLKIGKERLHKNISRKHANKSGVLEMEVDLHIEELMENYSNMSNAEIIMVQLSHFQKALDKAISNNMHKIIFIHGVGSGRLKNEIHSFLNGRDDLQFYDASYKKYGYGATEVVISNRARD